MTYTYSDDVAKLVDQAGLPQGYDTKIADLIRKSIRENTGKRVKGTQPWLGTPDSHFPLVWTPTLHAMVANGEIEVAERPKVVNPQIMARFWRFR